MLHFCEWKCCPILLDIRLQLLNSLILILLFMMHHSFSVGNRSELQASQAHLLIYESTLSLHVQNEAWHCLALITMDFLGKDVILMAAYATVQSQYMPQRQWYLQTYARHAVDRCTPYHDRCWLVQIRMVSFVFGM